MATGDTKLTICNDALIMLGGSPMASLSDGEDKAMIADRLYDDIRDSLLTAYPWTFALKKVQLAQTGDTPANEWTYEYQLPINRLGPIRAVFTSSAAGAMPLRHGWEVYEDKLLTDETTIYVDYLFRPNESAFPEYFVHLLKHALAAEFAGPLTDQDTKGAEFRERAYGTPGENWRGGLFRRAANVDGQGQPPRVIEDFSLVAVRY